MTINRAGSILIMCAAIAVAQEKMTVPLSNPSQPATLKVHVLMGSITVTAGAPAGQILVESVAAASKKGGDAPAGMHRIDSFGGGLNIEEDHNVVTIGSSSFAGRENVVVQVPANTSLQLKTVNGGKVEVTGVSGEIEVQNINGNVALMNVSGSVVASSQNGNISASLDKVTAGKPMSFTTLNGKIDVTLPADTKARLKLKTDNGSAYTDFDMKPEPSQSKPEVVQSGSSKGKYKISMDRSVYGSINGGGPEFRFETMNGTILIHKK